MTDIAASSSWLPCIHHNFERQATLTPQAVAVECAGRSLTYRELDERANQLAHALLKAGVGPDSLVGLCLDRSIDLVVGVLGILKAGAAYVPIDPQYPDDRRRFMLQDARCSLMVTEQALAPDVSGTDTRVMLIDAAIAGSPTTRPDVEVAASNLAYVIYTSGSTGKPKGTLIPHSNVVRLFEATESWFGFGERDVWTLFHSAAFDFSVWEIWGALLNGGRLVVVPFGLSRTPDDFHRLLCDRGVTVLNQTPSAFRQLMRADEAAARADLTLRYVIFGGEALDLAMLKPWFDRHGDARPQLINMYGITETTVHVTYRPVTARDVDGGSVIGVPIPDLQIHLLDASGKQVADGDAGEIHVGGAGVALGYLNRPEMTAQRFVPDPFAEPEPHGARRLMYRSGDLGRRLPGGDLEYLGRIDTQVKIRGFRIELSEISAVINRHAGVLDSVVVVGESATGDKVLWGYIVRRAGADVEIAALRRQLREHLPEYMIPAAFVFIDRLPLTVNGKLDRDALPAPTVMAVTATPPGAAAATSLEHGIAAIWQEVLQVPTPGMDENFFDVGGTSIHVAEVHARLQRLLDRSFSITELFAHSTIRALAAHFAVSTPGAAGEAQRRAQQQREALARRRPVRPGGGRGSPPGPA